MCVCVCDCLNFFCHPPLNFWFLFPFSFFLNLEIAILVRIWERDQIGGFDCIIVLRVQFYDMVSPAYAFN